MPSLLPGLRKLTQSADALWIGVSFALVGAAGLVLVLGIARYYSPAELGAFNLVYSLYIIASQLVGAGIHFSVLHCVPGHNRQRTDLAPILASAVLCSAANSLVWIAMLVAAAALVLPLFASRLLLDSAPFILPALLVCGQNKVLLAYLNARQQVRSFSIFTGLRGIAMLVFLVAAVAIDLPGHQLPLILSTAEIVLYLALLCFVRRDLWPVTWLSVRAWMKPHLSFGYRSVIGSIFVDINTRVDVLVLGLFSTDRTVGIYSLAAMLYDGFSQLPIVIRTLINPRLAILHRQHGSDELAGYLRVVRNRSYLFLGTAGAIVAVLYYPTVHLLALDEDFKRGFAPLAMLLTGAILTSGYSPLLMVFNQLGLPVRQSLLYLICFASNLVLNLMLVPIWGMHGSAAGTAASCLAFALALRLMLRRSTGIRI